MPRVLIADKLETAGIELLKSAGIEVEIRLGLSGPDLAATLLEFDAVIVRSQPKITAAVLESPGKLRAIARAGVGVDNIDVPAATRKGIAGVVTMKQIRIAFGVLLLALCVGTSVTAQLPPDPGCTDCAVNNSVILANVNSTFDSTAVVSGSFLAVPNVTVAIQVYGASTDGGVFGGNAASTINTQNKMWSGTINNLKEQNYNFYAIATFSDGTVLSSTFSPSAITSQKNKRNE